LKTRNCSSDLSPNIKYIVELNDNNNDDDDDDDDDNNNNNNNKRKVTHQEGVWENVRTSPLTLNP
jgi:hypothetical protein